MAFTITRVAPNNSTFQTSPNHSTSGRILSLALAADSNRIYAGSVAGVWRSDDSGLTFYQLTGPLTDTAGPGIFSVIYAPHIFDLAASPTDPNLVLAAARDGQFAISRDGIYRTTDGGLSWELVLVSGTVSQILFAPDDPSLVYAAVGFGGVARSTDAGKTWTLQSVGGSNVWHVAVAPQEGPGVRKIYAAGDSAIFFSPDGGNSWSFDGGGSTINTARSKLAAFQVSCKGDGVGGFAGMSATNSGSNPQILAVEPGNPAKVYLATVGGALGPCFYDSNIADGVSVNTDCKRLAGEGSLWYGDFSQFGTAKAAQWTQLPGPPIYNGGGDTPSGNMYVITKRTSSGFLVFFSDMGHVHVSQGTPAAQSWHRLGGGDISQARKDGKNRNVMVVHADPHGLIFTPDFEITLKPASGVSAPYDANSELNQYVAGTIWMANDGGVYRSVDGGNNWPAANGLETLDPLNIAGLFGIGNTPALYFGCGDNDDFYTPDGGQHYFDPASTCGDCDCWFSDVADASRVLQFEPRFFVGNVRTPKINIITAADSSHYPDPTDLSHTRHIPATLRVRKPGDIASEYTQSGFVLRGYRPIIHTLATEAALPDGDYVFIHSSDGVSRKVLRTTSISSITQASDWDDPTKAQAIGTPLPPSPNGTEPVVQASGGHANPVFYVGYDSGLLIKWDNTAGIWKTIVPGGPPGRAATGAISFYADPYHPEIVYLVDKSGIKVSLDGGGSWLPEVRLAQLVTANGKIRGTTPSVISDMQFSRGEESTRFAFGDAGVFFTLNGLDWITLLDAVAIPGRPESGFFDPISDPFDRAVYVELEGRSILRIGGIPGPPPFQPPPVFDLLEFAAIVEA